MSSISESVRRMLSEYEFQVNNPELTCILCKKLIIDAYQSFCGCNYCQSCITNYLSGESKYCVGEKEECKEEYLILDNNVVICPRINNRILKLKVRCPNQSCTFETELNKIENHIIGCTERPITCPYLNIGCTNERGSKTEVINHLYKDQLTHANLLSEFVEITRNEILYLKEESRKKEIQMKEIIEEIAILKNTLNNKDKIIEDQRKSLETTKEELRRESENIVPIVEMKNHLDEQSNKIDVCMDNVGRRESQIEVMRETQKKMTIEEVENIKREVENQKNSLNDLKENQENIWRETRLIIKSVKNFQMYDERKEFMCIVDNFSKMEDRRIILWRYSIKFYILVWCDRDDFGFICKIMKGEFDNIIDWPMKHKIRLSLINQNTMEAHKYQEYQYDTLQNKSVFDKPTKEWNDYFGDYRFSSVKDIKESPGVLLHDSLIVSFTIDYK